MSIGKELLERNELVKIAVLDTMRKRCEEQGHIWKRGGGDDGSKGWIKRALDSATEITHGLECKWCGFRI